jgi:deoxycytidylate deaminase
MNYPYKVNQADITLMIGGEEVSLQVSGDCIPPDTIIKSAYQTVKGSICNRYKHAAVIYRKRQIISASFNVQRKSHPNGSGPYMTLHAEVRALNHALTKLESLEGTRMFVLRTNNQGVIKTSKPCKDCRKYIERTGVSVCWTDGINEDQQINSPLAVRLRNTYEDFERIK